MRSMMNSVSIRKQTKKWTTKDGTKIRICDMSNQHLLNAIRFLQRGAESLREETIQFYLICPAPNLDTVAYDCFDREFNVAVESEPEDYLPEIYNDLMRDAERRGLDV